MQLGSPYTFGAHALEFGGEIRRARLDVFYYREARGGSSWDGNEPQAPWKDDASFSQPEKALANNYDFRRDYGNADFDYRHVFSGYVLYAAMLQASAMASRATCRSRSSSCGEISGLPV
jgi:hypothetical protein